MPAHPPVTPEGTFLQAFRLNHALRRHSGAGGSLSYGIPLLPQLRRHFFSGRCISYGIPSKTPVQASLSRRRAHFSREGHCILAQESRFSARTASCLSAVHRQGRPRPEVHQSRQGHHADKGRRGQASCRLLAGQDRPTRDPNRPTCQAHQTSHPTWDDPNQSPQRGVRRTVALLALPAGIQQSRRGSSRSPPERSAAGLPCPPQMGHDRRPMTRRYPPLVAPGSTVPGTTLLPQCSGEPESPPSASGCTMATQLLGTKQEP